MKKYLVLYNADRELYTCNARRGTRVRVHTQRATRASIFFLLPFYFFFQGSLLLLLVSFMLSSPVLETKIIFSQTPVYPSVLVVVVVVVDVGRNTHDLYVAVSMCVFGQRREFLYSARYCSFSISTYFRSNICLFIYCFILMSCRTAESFLRRNQWSMSQVKIAVFLCRISHWVGCWS